MPFKSASQRRKFYHMAKTGEMSMSKVKEWERETLKDKQLPERLSPKRPPYKRTKRNG